MQHYLPIVFYSFLFFRLLTVYISAKNEKRLKKIGAIEFGKKNSQWLIIAHFSYYLCCFVEGYVKGAFFKDGLTFIGVVIFVCAILVLFYVIYSIKHIWTVKLLVAPKAYHTINRNFLFKYVKHPNYFLNIIPELIGLSFIFHSWYSLFIGMPVYLVPLIIRIQQEEKVMKKYFTEYL
jgi:isoprenylcysteine carboxyl methyltransferase (ICMT) family protein YpbQ